ncbi:MAG TPA: hypothetical protein VF045_05285, partial [Acidimicrobiales bacterium]
AVGGAGISLTALLLLDAPASADNLDDRSARSAARQAEVAERNAQRQADIAERQAERVEEVAQRKAARQVEVQARAPVRQAEVAARAVAREAAEAGCDCLAPDGFGSPATFTLDQHFDRGDLNNVVHTPSDQLQLAEKTSPFPFLWVAVSSRNGVPNQKGTIVKIDTRTGQIVGEYWTSPEGQSANPSRTTVDPWGNVWATNRDGNSVVRIGMVENHQCIDRNGNGVIETSTGQGQILPWVDPSGTDTNGGVSMATDECVIAYARTTAGGARHISVAMSQDVWASGTSAPPGAPFSAEESFDLIRPDGTVIRTEPSVHYGGYGGLTDPNGVLWSAGPTRDGGSQGLLRWETTDPVTGTINPLTGLQLAAQTPGPAPGPVTGYPGNLIAPGVISIYGVASYGLCIDSQGNIWNADRYDGMVRKFAPDGTLLGTFRHGGPGKRDAQGCVVDLNDHVWVAHSTAGSNNTVGHLDNNGVHLGDLTVGVGPTGAAVDRDGFVWVTNFQSGTVSKIDPTAGPVGAVIPPTINVMGSPYNYSDMTGSAVPVHPKTGHWEVVYDCGPLVDGVWGPITGTFIVPPGGDLVFTASTSVDGTTFSAPVRFTPGTIPAVPQGRYLKLRVVFIRDPVGGSSPVLFDVTVRGVDPARTDCCPPEVPHVLPVEPPVTPETPVTPIGPVPPEPVPFLVGGPSPAAATRTALALTGPGAAMEALGALALLFVLLGAGCLAAGSGARTGRA